MKFKTSEEEWKNTTSCAVCRQEFNPQKNLNKHHWYQYYNIVEYVDHQSAVSVLGRKLTNRDPVIFAS